MKTVHCLGAAIAATLLVACAPAQVKMPTGFADRAVVHAVDGHSPRRFNQPIFIGPYSARRLEDGDTFQWTLGAGRSALVDSARDYAFTLTTAGAPPVEVQCQTRQSALRYGDEDSMLELDLTAAEGPLLSCGLRLGGAGPVQALELGARGRHLEGRLDSPWGGFSLRGLHGLAGSSLSTMDANGFELSRGGAPWMVVETINAGRVLLEPVADPRQRAYLAAAATALLLLDADLGD